MKAVLHFVCLLGLSLIFHSNISAQNPSQVIVANGGVFGPSNTVRIGYWNLATGGYMDFDSFTASSVQHVLIHDRKAYVCADSFVVKYNIDSHQREAMEVIYGARQTQVYQNKLLISKGFGSTGNHVEVRNLSDLSPDYSFSGLSGECEGIAVVLDSAYIAVPRYYGAPTGKLAVASLQNHVLGREIDLDSNGRAIKNVYAYGRKIFTINTIEFFSPYGVITEYDLDSLTITNHIVNHNTSQGAGLFQGVLYAQFDGALGSFDINTGTIRNANLVPGYWASMALDSAIQRLFTVKTDYATYGKLFSFDLNGNALDSITIGVSAEAIAVDYNIITRNADVVENDRMLHVYPQPFSQSLHVDLREFHSFSGKLELFDLAGRMVLAKEIVGNGIQTLETSTVAPGAYILKAQSRNVVATVKVMKVNE